MRYILLTAVSFFLLSVYSLDPYDLSDMEKAVSEKEDEHGEPFSAEHETNFDGFLLLPVYYNVDGNSSAGGLTSLYYYRYKGEGIYSRPSYIRGKFIFGGSSYFDIGIISNNLWKKGYNNIYSLLNFTSSYMPYWGISGISQNILGTYRSSDIDFKFIYRQKVTDRNYFGLVFHFRNNSMSKFDPVAEFDERSVPGIRGSRVSGIGITAGGINPDDIFVLPDGWTYEFSNIIYLKYFGSTHDFAVHEFDLRNYTVFMKTHLLATQFFTDLRSGDAPFRHKSRLGNVLRAYSSERFVDNHSLALRAEYRTSLYSRVLGALFAGIGYHLYKLSKFKLNDVLYSYGGGLRFVIDTELNINARLDYAVGKNSKAFIITIGEEF